MDWSNGFRFGEMMERSIKPGDNSSITVHSLSVEEIRIDGGDKEVTYSDKISTAVEVNTKDFVARAGGWKGVEAGYIKVDSHAVRALVQVGDYLYVIIHASTVRKDSRGSSLVNGGKTDKIAIASLADIPDAYWKSLDIEPPIL